MEKIHIEIKTPGNGKAYEFEVEADATVLEFINYAATQIETLETGNITFDREKVLLCSAVDESVLNPDAELYSAGVRTGHTLILL